MDVDYGIEVSKTVKILFPIVVTIVAGIIAPISVPLIGSLMFGNLIRECGVLDRLSQTAQNELGNLVTLLLGITIGSTMVAERFLTWNTLLILSIGLLAFVFDTAFGVLFAKFINLFLKHKINPIIGACGISAFPCRPASLRKLPKGRPHKLYPDAGSRRQCCRTNRIHNSRSYNSGTAKLGGF